MPLKCPCLFQITVQGFGTHHLYLAADCKIITILLVFIHSFEIPGMLGWGGEGGGWVRQDDTKVIYKESTLGTNVVYPIVNSLNCIKR